MTVNIAKWNVWLLNDGQPPLLYMGSLTEAEAQEWATHAIDKVFDGSDADAVVICRNDRMPSNVIWRKV